MLIRHLTKVAIAFVFAVAFSTTSYAQSTILVVDTGRVIKESTVGQHIARQLETIYSSAESEIKAKSSPLESRSKSLQAQAVAKGSQQALIADSALVSQLQSHQTELQKLQVDALYTERELKITEEKALRQVSQRIKIIIDQIARERNADVVLEKSLVIYGGPADVTDTVISRLNSQMTTVPVTRERLPRKG